MRPRATALPPLLATGLGGGLGGRGLDDVDELWCGLGCECLLGLCEGEVAGAVL
jgi:hypothetical protein